MSTTWKFYTPATCREQIATLEQYCAGPLLQPHRLLGCVYLDFLKEAITMFHRLLDSASDCLTIEFLRPACKQLDALLCYLQSETKVTVGFTKRADDLRQLARTEYRLIFPEAGNVSA